MTKLYALPFILLPVIFLIGACNPVPTQSAVPQEDAVTIVATTTILGDVVSQVAGNQANVITLLPYGADPHSFQPTPQDIALITNAELIFINGLGLESFLTTILENTNNRSRIVSVSEGIAPISATEGHAEDGKISIDEPEQDPHVWMDPNNVITWVNNIEKSLSEIDSDHTDEYASNANAYRQKLRDLDKWIREQTSSITDENRELVTDHQNFAYFASQYGFKQVGAVIPGYSTISEPSAQELAALEDSIHSLNVKAIFVGDTVNSTLSEQIAADTGVQIIFLHTGSLTEPDGSAPTYLDYIRYNVDKIVSALN